VWRSAHSGIQTGKRSPSLLCVLCCLFLALLLALLAVSFQLPLLWLAAVWSVCAAR
jgi:hypothetical protein